MDGTGSQDRLFTAKIGTKEGGAILISFNIIGEQNVLVHPISTNFEDFCDEKRFTSRMSLIVSDPNEILLQKNYDRSQLAEAILDRHYAALHYLAYSILGDADESDDVVQESILGALAKINRYRPGSNMKAWLSTRGKYVIRPFFTLLERMVKHKGEIPADFHCTPLEGCEFSAVLRIYPQSGKKKHLNVGFFTYL